MNMKRAHKSRPRSRKRDPHRQRIVDAARIHFLSHGFRSVTMDDLAEELGISKKTLYAHFPGKFDLLEAVLADKFAGVEAALKEVTRTHPHDFPATLHELLAGTQRELDRKSTRLNSSHSQISYAVFCLKKKTAHCTYPSAHPTEIPERVRCEHPNHSYGRGSCIVFFQIQEQL